jgi:hypothetical protein
LNCHVILRVRLYRYLEVLWLGIVEANDQNHSQLSEQEVVLSATPEPQTPVGKSVKEMGPSFHQPKVDEITECTTPSPKDRIEHRILRLLRK